MNSIEAVSSAYAATRPDCDKDKVSDAITGHIQCIISERAAVNKCVLESLEDALHKDL